MLRRDRIFWMAAGIFVLAIVLFVVTQNQLWLALMIASYLLRPTLASFGVARRYVDERQMSIHYRSGNIAFAAMMITAVVLAVFLSFKDDNSWEMFNLLIIIGLATKALFNVLLIKDYRAAAIRIIISVGLLISLFVLMEEGLSLGTLVNGAPGFIIVGIGLLAKKYPRAVGTLVFVVTATMVVLILTLGKGTMLVQITTALLIGLPLALAGVCLFTRDPEEAAASAQNPSASLAAD